MNKYNEFMSHITIDDDMRKRVLDNVFEHIGDTPAVPLPVKKKARISPILIASYAVAGLLVVGVAVFIATRFAHQMAPEYKRASAQDNATEAAVAATTVAGISDEIDSFVGCEEEDTKPDDPMLYTPEGAATSGDAQNSLRQEASDLVITEGNGSIEDYLNKSDNILWTDILNVNVLLRDRADEEKLYYEAVWEIDGSVYIARSFSPASEEEWQNKLMDIIKDML